MDLLCNIRTCRKPLTGTLWITSCSHSFCDEHGKSLSHKNVKCQACNTVLGKRFDIIRQNANPAQNYRAMLLVGLRPEMVLEIAVCAVSFWNYQMEQELKFQASTAKNLRETAEKIKEDHATMIKQLSSAKKTSESREKQIDELKITIKQLKDQIAHRDRQLQKMLNVFNSLGKKTNASPKDATDTHNFLSQQHQILGPQDYNVRHGIGNANNCGKQTDFVFEPRLAGPKKHH